MDDRLVLGSYWQTRDGQKCRLMGLFINDANQTFVSLAYLDVSKASKPELPPNQMFDFNFLANFAPWVEPVDRTKQCTTSGEDPEAVRLRQQEEGNVGQHSSYIVLCDEERAKGFVRPVRSKYVHVGVGGHEIDPSDPSKHGRTGNGCGAATSMGKALSETYARDPKFYSHTFCVGCNKHFPVEEFVWEDGSVVGS